MDSLKNVLHKIIPYSRSVVNGLEDKNNQKHRRSGVFIYKAPSGRGLRDSGGGARVHYN